MRKSTSFISVLVLLLGASIANAQQSVLINRGSIAISQLAFPYASYEFTGPSAQIRAFIPSGDGTARPSCIPCIGGEQVAVDANFFSEKLGTATINGNSRDVYIRSSLILNGGSITMPNRFGVIFGFVTRPATLTGTLTGFASNPGGSGGGGDPLFIIPVNFVGTVTVFTRYFGQFNGAPWFSTRQIIYTFATSNQDEKQK